MSKKIIIGVVVVVFLLLLGGGFFFLNRTQENKLSPSQSSKSSNGVPNEKQSLKDLMQLTNNQQCTFTDTESQNSGTIYVSGGKARGDFETEVDGQKMGSHMFSDGQFVYVWMDGQTQGFKTAISDVDSDAKNPEQKTVDVNKQLDYSCKGWSVDQSVFTLPSNVTFQDFSSMMKTVNPSGTMMQDNTSACSACDSLSGDAQTQCKAALNCN